MSILLKTTTIKKTNYLLIKVHFLAFTYYKIYLSTTLYTYIENMFIFVMNIFTHITFIYKYNVFLKALKLPNLYKQKYHSIPIPKKENKKYFMDFLTLLIYYILSDTNVPEEYICK